MSLRLKRPRSKYNARRTTVDGVTFASQKEARRYQELKMLEMAGEIRHLRLQPEFALSVDNRLYPENDHGRSIDLGHYVADFSYEQRHQVGSRYIWREVVEDVKGFKTPLYRWKKKHVEAQYGIQVREV